MILTLTLHESIQVWKETPQKAKMLCCFKVSPDLTHWFWLLDFSLPSKPISHRLDQTEPWFGSYPVWELLFTFSDLIQWDIGKMSHRSTQREVEIKFLIETRYNNIIKSNLEKKSQIVTHIRYFTFEVSISFTWITVLTTATVAFCMAAEVLELKLSYPVQHCGHTAKLQDLHVWVHVIFTCSATTSSHWSRNYKCPVKPVN